MSFSKLLVYTFLSGLAINSCTCSPGSRSDSSSGGDGKTVNLSIWSGYVADAVLQDFTKVTGIRVNVSNYSSNEELLAKLQAGARGVDVAVPSDYMVSIMGNLRLLSPLNKANLPNAAGLDPTFLAKDYDPQNQFSVPFSWTFTGIAINRHLSKVKISSWKDFFSDEVLKQKVSVLDDARETLGAVLKMQGHSLNTKNPEELKQAKQFLNGVRERFSAFTSEPHDGLIQGEFKVSHMYSSDGLQARGKTGGKVEMVIPVEGGAMAIDNLVIPSTADHIEAAHALINYLISKEVSANRAQVNFAGAVVKGVKEMLPKELQNDQLLFPPADLLKKLEMMQDLGDATALYDRAWTELKAGQK